MGVNKCSVLTRVRRAVRKVRFLLDFSIRWQLASMVGSASSNTNHRLSFNDRPGLKAYTDDSFDLDSEDSGSSSRPGLALQKMMSYPSEDDVDKRAEMFIANFYHQLRIERQISLELQYCRGNSFKAISP
ncbi:uncharacterized protein LOC121263187 [Juglans microcarpa x Juglans regia]|uniref:uncharacterized protein LOC121263187 n=1 Tax=Juglans microcarpa x Juglans regia TaxID=2249226 RepID=UPI001B7E1696|nr:uncharacterized protein LOC121263187 [Juglans microcarpa x Juglans regia]